LSAEQRLRLETLLVARNQSVYDTADAASLANLPEAEKNLAIKNTLAAINSEIVDLIGADGQKQLEQGSGLEGIFTSIDSGVAVDLSEEGTPLSEDQRNKLAQAIFDSSRLHQDLADTSSGSDGTISEQGAAVLARARTFLSPNQISTLEDFEKEQLSRWKYDTSPH
jgi:hypothetical protein